MSSPHAKLLTKPTIPFAEAPWHHGLPNPYYTKKSHFELREWLKKWVEKHMTDQADELDLANEHDPSLYAKMAKEGFLLPFCLGVSVPQKYVDLAGGQKLPGGVAADDWDHFHDFIMVDELTRPATNNLFMASYGGLAYGGGPIVHFGSDDLQKRFLPDLLTGKKRICLAITEPSAGSDVAGVSTTATKSEDGKHYIVRGTKKWITNGIYSDYFTTAVRTSGKPGEHKGISFLVIPRSEGLTTKKMAMQQSGGSGTTFVELDDVKVPVENLVGKEGEAFKYIMYNFQHERATIVYIALRLCRVCIEDSMAHAKRRMVFGKPLIDQPVVRFRLAHMARETEALQAWTEALVYQASKMSVEQGNVLLGGQFGLIKAHAGIVVESVCSSATMIMGGMGITRGGAAARIERTWRELKALSIPGGSEDVLLDLGVRQQLKIVNSKQSKI